MSKLIAEKVYQSLLPDNKVGITFVATDRYAANLFVRELEHLDKIDITAKGHKESRSLRQNRMLWAVIGKISEHLNYEKSEASTWKIYGELLVKAQVKRELVAVLPEAIDLLRAEFRAVVPTGQTISAYNEKLKRETTLHTCWVYFGSSKFNTKEMTELLDITLAYASELGIVDSEIESIRAEYL